MATDQPLLTNWAIPPFMSVRMKTSLISWTASTETDPKGGGASPPGTSLWYYRALTKAPFEPIKEASLKHLTFKTVFLLSLGSGKRRSDIHAWQNKNIRHHSDWSKVSLYPSPSFLSKNQLAKEGPDSVAPVVIPALDPTLDKSLRSDRSLCPSELCATIWTGPQMEQRVRLCLLQERLPQEHLACHYLLLDQTVILCYELLTLHQVKAHDVRAFAASKAFQSGLSTPSHNSI